MSDDLESRVANLDALTTDLSRLMNQSRLKLSDNERGIANLAVKLDTTASNILAALTKLQGSQDIHMARSDEKFTGVVISLDKVVDKLDVTSQRLSANESLSNQLRTQNACQFEQLGEVESGLASLRTSLKDSADGVGNPTPSLINSPNFRWIMAPIIIILVGLFGLAGYNMSGDVQTILNIPGTAP